MVGRYKKGFTLKKNHFTTQISKRFASYRHFDRGNSGWSDRDIRVVSPAFWYFRYIASIYLTLHKRLWRQLATNKAICLKTKKINKRMYFKRFLATKNKYISVIAHSTHWSDIGHTLNIDAPPPLHNTKLTWDGQL